MGKKKRCGTVTLDMIAVGEEARIDRLTRSCSAKGRLTDLGFRKGETVECVMASPLGDPRAYRIRGMTVALRNSDAKGVALTK